jgi:hypothetical protein
MRCDDLDNTRWFAMRRAWRLIVALCSLPLQASDGYATTHVEVAETFPVLRKLTGADAA